MGLRETMNKNPAMVTGITAGAIVLALGFIIWQLAGGSGFGSAEFKELRYYTVDDGATWQEMPIDTAHISPFQKDGKTAYEVILGTCDGGKTKQPIYLVRYTGAARKELESKNGVIENWDLLVGVQYKLPKVGDLPNLWITETDPRLGQLQLRPCPGGGTMERTY